MISVTHLAVVIVVAATWPSWWTSDQIHVADKIVKFSYLNGLNPSEMVAIAWTETRLREQAISSTGDFGLFQINCRVWHKQLGFINRDECYIGMLDYEANIEAAAFIIVLYRGRYQQCQGRYIYHCYNGGPGWMRSKNIDKIRRYGKRVRMFKRQFRRYIKSNATRSRRTRRMRKKYSC